MAELILLFLALACLSSSASAAVFFCGIAVAVLVFKRRNQQKEIERLQSEFKEQADALRREIRSTRDVADKLNAQLAEFKLAVSKGAVVAASTAADTIPSQAPARETHPVATIAPPAVQPAKPAVAEPAKPVVVAPNPQPAKPITAEVKPAQPTAAPTAPNTPAQPPQVAPQQQPVAPKAPEPIAPASPATPVVPTAPARPTPIAPSPVAPSTPVVTPAPVIPPIRVEAPRPAASVQALPPPAFRPPAKPQPTLTERLRKALAIEETLGTNWLNKLGIIILVLGVALFGMYELKELGPIGKVLLLFTVGAGLLGGGIYLDRGDRYRIIGRTAIGGGWALLFFTSYGAHHVDAMRVLFTETPDLILMLGVAVAMALHTLRYRSQAVTGMAFLLAYSTITLTHDTVYALSAGATLAVGLVIISIKMHWYELEVFGILSSYLNHLYWLVKLLGIQGANHHAFPEFYASTAILAFYWFVYRFSYVVRKIDSALQENVSAVAALLNTILLLAVMKFQSVHPELAFFALLALGALELGFGQAALARKRRQAFILLSILGATLMIMAVPFRYSGENRAVLWMIGAEAFIAAGILLRENVFRRIGNFTALLVALHIVALEVVPLFKARGVTHGPLIHSGVLLLTAGCLFLVNAHPLRWRWSELYSEKLDAYLLTAQSYIGTATLALGLWAITPYQWTIVVWAGLLIALAFASAKSKGIDLYQQSMVLAMLIMVRAFATNFPQPFVEDWNPHFPRVALVIFVALAMYLSAWPIGNAQGEPWARGLLTWFGTALLTYLIATDVQHRWICVAWLALGIALIGPARRWKIFDLCYQEHVLAVLATIWASGNFPDSATGTLTQRIVPTLLVAAGLYAISRKASLWTDQRERWVAYLHTWAATALMVNVARIEFTAIRLPLVWMGFALTLAFIARRFRVKEFAAQSHVVSTLAVIQTIFAVLPSELKFHGISERLPFSLIIIGALYLLSRLAPFSEEHRALNLHHAYTWVASFLSAGLLWYELQPLSVAVGWALFGLVLFEIGTVRKVIQVRYQGYVALFSAFGRIFVVNVAASSLAGDWLSPRMMTVMPVALILFFVYSQLAFTDELKTRTGRFDVTTMMAYAGSISVGAVLYFQVSSGWIATSWAVLVPILLAAALLLEQEVFLQQALLLTLAIFSRGMIHNLFGGSYFTDGSWKGRFAELGSAIALVLLSLPLAFRLKHHFEEKKGESALRNLISRLVSRPEQVIFFVPIVLLTFMLALKMRAGMVTVAWGLEAVAVMLLALAVNERSFRLSGLGLLLLCVGKIMVIDAWRLAPRDRYLTFIVLGLALLGVSFLYTRYREAIREYL